jgi:hypothetical protein
MSMKTMKKNEKIEKMVMWIMRMTEITMIMTPITKRMMHKVKGLIREEKHVELRVK